MRFHESKMRDECVVIADGPGALVELCGISILERLLRTLQRCVVKRAIVLSSTPKQISDALAQPSWPRVEIDLRVYHRCGESVTIEEIINVWPGATQLLLIVRGDSVFDNRLLRHLLTQDSSAALVDSSVPVEFESLVVSAPNTNAGKLCGAALLRYDWTLAQSSSFDSAVRGGLEKRIITPVDVAQRPFYDPALRRKLRPFWFPALRRSKRRSQCCWRKRL